MRLFPFKITRKPRIPSLFELNERFRLLEEFVTERIAVVEKVALRLEKRDYRQGKKLPENGDEEVELPPPATLPELAPGDPPPPGYQF